MSLHYTRQSGIVETARRDPAGKLIVPNAIMPSNVLPILFSLSDDCVTTAKRENTARWLGRVLAMGH